MPDPSLPGSAPRDLAPSSDPRRLPRRTVRTALRRPVVVIALLLGLVGATLGVVTPTATAGSGCWGSGCNDKNPHTTGCDVGPYTTTLYTKRDRPSGWDNGKAELRYSILCSSVWARYSDPTIPNCGYPALGIQIGTMSGGSVSVVNSITKHSDQCAFYTNMLNGDNRYARIRVGSFYSWPGGSDITWGSWSPWVKVS